LSEKESVVECLSDLVYWYEKRTGIYYDSLVMRACEVGLKINPISRLQCCKADALKYHLEDAMQQKGLVKENDYHKINSYPDLKVLYNDYHKVRMFIKKIGYRDLTKEQYSERLLFVEEEKEKTQDKKKK